MGVAPCRPVRPTGRVGIKYRRVVRIGLICILALMLTPSAQAAGMKLGNLCRVRGQEVNTLQGLGLVVGLRGTGDNDAAPTARALARMMQLMGGPITADRTGQLNLKDVAGSKNVAMVIVTAKVPEAGAQQGDLLDINVSAISAKSLEGGRLLNTPLLGPRTDDQTVYALAQGQLRVSPDGAATVASVEGGAKMESTIKTSFQRDGVLTLVLDQDFADFNTTQMLQEDINTFVAITLGDPAAGGGFPAAAESFSSRPGGTSATSALGQSPQGRDWARAIDQLHVEVLIPDLYRNDPVRFLSLLLDMPIQLFPRGNRVVINEADGIVVIGKDVEIAPGLITHRNLRIEAGGGGFVDIGQSENPDTNAKLKALADALNALDVPTEDLIAIIKTLKAKGDLYGEVIFR